MFKISHVEALKLLLEAETEYYAQLKTALGRSDIASLGATKLSELKTAAPIKPVTIERLKFLAKKSEEWKEFWHYASQPKTVSDLLAGARWVAVQTRAPHLNPVILCIAEKLGLHSCRVLSDDLVSSCTENQGFEVMMLFAELEEEFSCPQPEDTEAIESMTLWGLFRLVLSWLPEFQEG